MIPTIDAAILARFTQANAERAKQAKPEKVKKAKTPKETNVQRIQKSIKVALPSVPGEALSIAEWLLLESRRYKLVSKPGSAPIKASVSLETCFAEACATLKGNPQWESTVISVATGLISFASAVDCARKLMQVKHYTTEKPLSRPMKPVVVVGEKASPDAFKLAQELRKLKGIVEYDSKIDDGSGIVNKAGYAGLILGCDGKAAERFAQSQERLACLMSK